MIDVHPVASARNLCGSLSRWIARPTSDTLSCPRIRGVRLAFAPPVSSTHAVLHACRARQDGRSSIHFSPRRPHALRSSRGPARASADDSWARRLATTLRKAWTSCAQTHTCTWCVRAGSASEASRPAPSLPRCAAPRRRHPPAAARQVRRG